jgi:tetratricopeptide (TPR) repeat protein/tRNA A-37 threonylcarbamoyl transferase component Bud32
MGRPADDHLSDAELKLFLAGELPEAELDRIEAHLNRCDECLARLEELKRMCHQSSMDGSLAPQVPGPTGSSACRSSMDDIREGSDSFGPPTDQAPLGQLGPYHVVAKLGEGSFGKVYLARLDGLDGDRAIKVLRSEYLSDLCVLERFRKEAVRASRVKDDHVVMIHWFGTFQDQYCRFYEVLDMDYIKGGSLDKRIKPGVPLEPQVAAAIVHQVARGLVAVHGRGIIHSDIKPHNILVDDEHTPPRFQITDFSVAQVLEQTRGVRANGSSWGGTAEYESPEHFDSPADLTVESDIHAVGVVLYELLTGELPFGDRKQGEEELKRRIREDTRRFPEALPSRAYPDLKAICLKCLAQKPEDRYDSAAKLAEDLSCYLEKRPLLYARKASAWERGWKWARRRPTAAALVVVSALAVLSLLAVSLVYNRKLGAALAATEQQRDLARKSLHTGVQAVDQSLMALADEHLRDMPGMEKKRADLLRAALDFYKGFLDANPRDAQVRQRTALAYRKVGELLYYLGDDQQSRDVLGKAEALQRELTAGFPLEPAYRRDLADTLHAYSRLLRNGRRWAEARVACDEAGRFQQQLAQDYPDEEVYRKNLAQHYHLLGDLEKDAKNKKQAADFYNEALKLDQDLANKPGNKRDDKRNLVLAHRWHNLGEVQSDPAEAQVCYLKAHELLRQAGVRSPDVRHELARVCDSLGRLSQDLPPVSLNLHASTVAFLAAPWGQGPFLATTTLVSDRTLWFEQGQKNFGAAIELQKALADDFPHTLRYRYELANHYVHQGELLHKNNQPQEALKAYLEALSLRERLAKDFPARPMFQGNLGMLCSQMGDLLKNEHPKEACRYWEQALVPLQTALERVPDNKSHQGRLLRSSQALARQLVNQEEHARALEAASKLAKASRKRGVGSYHAACFLADCVAGVGKSGRLPAEKCQGLKQMYGDRAMKYLSEALDKNREHTIRRLEEDVKKRLAPLAHRADFQRMLRTLFGESS